MATLSYGTTAIALDDQLHWTDEYAWRPVEQRQQYTLTGALVVESALKQAGRPVTLAGDRSRAWLPRSTVEQLRAAELLDGQVFTLVYRGVSRTVMFDHAAGGLSAEPIRPFQDPTDDDDYAVTLRFFEV